MTLRAGVIGDPIAHSRSPLIHGYWLDRYGIDGSYERHHVLPADLQAFVSELRRGQLVGCNVTVPHKEAIVGLVDRSTTVVEALGAANTLWQDGATLWADNTDVAGFLAHLDASAPGWSERTRRAAVLGAGGAARAVVYALVQRGLDEIIVVNRTVERAAELGRRFGPTVRAMADADVAAGLGGIQLLVNTTSLGMVGQPPLTIDLAPLPPDAVVYDIVYVPLLTDLLRQAGARGLLAVDGLGMLLHQAVPGFERWFGVKPEVTADLRARVVADIEGRT